MELRTEGREYWVICSRFNAHKATNPGIRNAAINDMIKLRETCRSKAVVTRVKSFIARNQRHSPGNNGGNGGGRIA